MSYYAVSPFDLPKLQEQLLSEIRTSDHMGHWLALVDTAFNHGAKALKWFSELTPVYDRARLASFRDVSPILLSLTATDDEALRHETSRLLRHCNGRPMLSFIRSMKAPQELCESWQSVLEVHAEDEQLFVLRFADTRTMPAIASVLRSDAWARLSNGIEKWLYIDRDGDLQALQLPEAQPAFDVDAKKPIRISDKKLAQLLDLGQPDALANALDEHFAELLPAGQGALVYRRLCAICELAKTHGIEAFPDVMALAVAACLTDGRLLESEEFSKWLKGRSWAATDFSTSLSDYIEKDFPWALD